MGTDSPKSYEIVDDGVSVTIRTGARDDEVTVRYLADGSAIATVNDEDVHLPADEASRLVIEAGAGRDVVVIRNAAGSKDSRGPDSDAELAPGVRVYGGADDDRIIGGDGDDILSGGPGRDYVDGGSGRDVLSGGSGKDTLSGGSGDDIMDGGAGDDYLDAAGGDDVLVGASGNDFLSGGAGDDRIDGGAGVDISAGGSGQDTFVSVEVSHVEFDPNSGSSISIEGDATFVARVESDIATLRSLSTGHALLDSLDASGRSTVIVESTTGKNSATIPKSEDARLQPDGTPGIGRDAKVKYNPMSNRRPGNEAYKQRPPIVALYHELLHAEDVVHGRVRGGWSIQVDANGEPVLDKSGLPRRVRNRELDAVGLPFDEANTADDKAGATMDPAELETNTRETTENAFREEIGEPERWRY